MTLTNAYRFGGAKALEKFALGPPTQVDQFMADVEQGQDMPPPGAVPPMAGPMGEHPMMHPPGLDGTTPLQLPSSSPPTPPSMGSTVGQLPPAPPQNMGGLS